MRVLALQLFAAAFSFLGVCLTPCGEAQSHCLSKARQQALAIAKVSVARSEQDGHLDMDLHVPGGQDLYLLEQVRIPSSYSYQTKSFHPEVSFAPTGLDPPCVKSLS